MSSFNASTSTPDLSVRPEESNTSSILSFHPAEVDIEFEETPAPEEEFINYENTYRMESINPFNEHEVSVVVQKEIDKYFNEKTKYDPYTAMKTCAAMSLSIRNSICEMKFERYKLVCVVEIVEKKSQGLYSIVKFLRDLEKDKFVKVCFENSNIFAFVVVAALYFE